jgi:inorganic pyrophosphatase
VGVIEGTQKQKKHLVRNDRIVAVEQANHSYAHIKHVDDLGKRFARELGQFFVNYHRLSGEEYQVLALKGRPPQSGGSCRRADSPVAKPKATCGDA